MISWFANRKNWGMAATLSRVVVTPIICVLLLHDSLWMRLAAALIFILASVTDYLDGMLARKYQAVSAAGALMDPVADKILTTSVFIFLVSQHNLDPWSVMLLLGRDTLISGVRSLAASQGKIISAQAAGKWKTALQMVAIPCLIVGSPVEIRSLEIPLLTLGQWIVWASVVLSIWSGIQYLVGYFRAES